jgi:phenylacetate-CoA ligase
VVTRENDQDVMCLQVECSEGTSSTLQDAVINSIRELTKLRGKVEFVASGSLPNDGKVIDDQRPIE